MHVGFRGSGVCRPDRGFERLEDTLAACGAIIQRIRGVPVSTLRRLVALDADDLAVISAHVQDAAVAIADIIWRQDEKRLVVGMQRQDWDRALHTEAQGRLVSALRFDRVLACKSRDIDLGAPAETRLGLLGIEFHESEPPGGSAVLLFAGGGALRLDVECLECELADLGEDTLGAEDAEVVETLGS